MKKTIASIAMIVGAASSANALMVPGGPKGKPVPTGVPQMKTVCLAIQQQNEVDGAVTVGSCDKSASNEDFGLELKSNGCAEGQVAIKTFSAIVKSCPTAAQL